MAINIIIDIVNKHHFNNIMINFLLCVCETLLVIHNRSIKKRI